MVSRIETGQGNAGQESQLATTTGVLQQRKRFDQNYRAMTMMMRYLPPIEQLRLQGLDKWQYDIGVSRVQVRLVWPELFYFADDQDQILAVSETGECQRFDCRGESYFSNQCWISCQIGRSRFFQCTDGSFRILKIDPSQRSFTVENEQASLEIISVRSLTNFKDQFILFFFHLTQFPPKRYSLAQDRWEKLPPLEKSCGLAACQLGDKVYVFAKQDFKNLIYVLRNPGASISSQELHWQVIEVPYNIVTAYDNAAFVPLNLTEIAILGGKDELQRPLGDVITFNTTNYQFKKEFETDPFVSRTNQSAKVHENTIIAVVQDKNNQKRLIQYKKGDTCITNILEYTQD